MKFLKNINWDKVITYVGIGLMAAGGAIIGQMQCDKEIKKQVKEQLTTLQNELIKCSDDESI